MDLVLTTRGRLVVVLLAAGACTGLVALRSDGDAPGSGHSSARSMAQQLGCVDTFEQTPAYAGVYSAGHCVVAGAVVELRTMSGSVQAAAWEDGARSAGAPGFAVVGKGWVARTSDETALAQVSGALAPSS